MTSNEAKVLLQRLVEATNTRQLDVLDEFIAPNFVRHCQATPQLDVRSREQFKEFLKQDATTFPDNTVTLTHILAEGDLAAGWGTYEGTQLGQMGPFPASGNKARVDVGAVLRVEDGKIAELWITWDNMTVLANEVICCEAKEIHLLHIDRPTRRRERSDVLSVEHAPMRTREVDVGRYHVALGDEVVHVPPKIGETVCQ